MIRHPDISPRQAIANTVLLFWPIFFGIGAFRIWFISNPEFHIYAVLVLISYYFALFSYFKKLTNISFLEGWKDTYPTWRKQFLAVLGFIMFSFMAYHGFYTVGPAFVTTVLGKSVVKELTVASIRKVYRSNGCRYEIRFVEASAPVGSGFCVGVDEFSTNWAKGSKVTLHGRESILGFRFTQIER